MIARSPGFRRLSLGASAMQMGAHNRAIDQRIFVVGVSCRCWKTRSRTPASAQRLNRRRTFFQSPNRSGRSRHGHSCTKAIEHRIDEQPVVHCGHVTPNVPSRPGSRSLIRSHWASRSPKSRDVSSQQADPLRIREFAAPEPPHLTIGPSGRHQTSVRARAWST